MSGSLIFIRILGRSSPYFWRRMCTVFSPWHSFPDKNVLEGFLKEKSIRRKFLMYIKEINIVLMGIGIPNTEYSTLLQTGYIDHQILEDFVRKGAVGDIALRFFNIRGETEPFLDFNDRVAGMSLLQLSRYHDVWEL